MQFRLGPQQNSMDKTETKTRSAISEMFRNSARVLRLTYGVDKWLAIAISAMFAALAFITFLDSGMQALLINKLISIADSGSWNNSLILLFLIYIGVRLLPDIVYNLRAYADWILWFRAEQKFNILLLNKKAELDIATHEDPAHNNLFNRIEENGVWRVANFASRLFFILQNILEITIASVILLSFSWWIFLVVVCALIPTLIVEAKYGGSAYSVAVETSGERREDTNLRSHFSDIGNLIELKLLDLSNFFIKEINRLHSIFRGRLEAPERKKLKYGMVATLCTQASVAVALGWSITQVVHGNMQIGTLTFVFASVGGIRNALGGLFLNLGVQYKDSLYLTEFFTLLDLKPRISTQTNVFVLPKNITPTVEFKDVSFRYTKSGSYVLKNINLTIKSGEKLAIVGVNGAGKTTLIKLLCRFYDPTSGQIIVDGRDLREIDLASWYAVLGAIFQDYPRYNLLVKEAIAISLSSSQLDRKRVEKAAISAEADLFIKEWDKQYDQRLGKKFDGGVEPSVGQWQKLALARAFYRDSRILILDEPTSSIDAEAEAKIFNKLETLPDDHTVILISHRFSTVRHTNQIIVLENGTISESGTHEELLKLNKTYAHLFKLQAKGYK